MKSESSEASPYLLDNSSKLLRPDMAQIVREPKSFPTDSCANEIVRQLTQIVREQEAYLPASEESPELDVAKPECRCDGDTFSQYSLELLNSEFISPSQNHSKSQSFETDNTDLSLPKFNAEIPSNFQPEVPKFDDHYKLNGKCRQEKLNPINRRDFSFPQKLINDESSKIYIIDASTPSPKSKRYVDSSLDSLELYQQPIRKIVEAEIHQQEESLKPVADFNEEDFSDKVKEVRDRRRPVTTIDLQAACDLPPNYHYQSQIAKMAIKGVF